MSINKNLLLFLLLISFSCKLENRTINETTEVIPNWIHKLYEFQNETGEFQQVLFFKQLNDTVSYCVFIKNEGFSCSTSYVATLVNKKEFQKIKIASACDINYDSIVYTYSKFKILKPNIIKSISYSEIVPDSLITIENSIKKGIGVLNIKRKIDSTFQFYKISSKGKILKK